MRKILIPQTWTNISTKLHRMHLYYETLFANNKISHYICYPNQPTKNRAILKHCLVVVMLDFFQTLQSYFVIFLLRSPETFQTGRIRKALRVGKTIKFSYHGKI